VRSDDLGEAEVNHLGHTFVGVVAHHDVLELQVTVHDAETVQVLDCLTNLVGEVNASGLRQLEATFLNVIKHVFAGHVVKHNEVVVAGFEDVNKLDDVRMLAHLQHFDFATLLEHLDRFHIRLLDGLDRHLLA
jgi:hypothetical protein